MGLVEDWTACTKKSGKASIVRAALAAAPVGAVPPFSPLYALCVELLEAHPRSTEKRAAGVSGFRVGAALKGRELLIERPDGSAEAMSWLKCCGMISRRGEISAAYREAVEDQIRPHRVPGMHVDHVAPMTFARIVELFEAQHGSASYDEVDHLSFVQERALFVEPRRRQFAEFHRAFAVLAVVTPEENMRRTRGINRAPSR